MTVKFIITIKVNFLICSFTDLSKRNFSQSTDFPQQIWDQICCGKKYFKVPLIQ